MSDDNVKHLVACLDYARAVNVALPIDDAADRAVNAALANRRAGHVGRKLTRK